VAEEFTQSRGVGAVTIANIAEAADLTRRAFRHYFDSKRNVLVPSARKTFKTAAFSRSAASPHKKIGHLERISGGMYPANPADRPETLKDL
jgi:AcrR family transcriptional regulator